MSIGETLLVALSKYGSQRDTLIGLTVVLRLPEPAMLNSTLQLVSAKRVCAYPALKYDS